MLWVCIPNGVVRARNTNFEEIPRNWFFWHWEDFETWKLCHKNWVAFFMNFEILIDDCILEHWLNELSTILQIYRNLKNVSRSNYYEYCTCESSTLSNAPSSAAPLKAALLNAPSQNFVLLSGTIPRAARPSTPLSSAALSNDPNPSAPFLNVVLWILYWRSTLSRLPYFKWCNSSAELHLRLFY